jgi:hypothetical protein
VGGQKINSKNELSIIRILKIKKFQRWRFLDFVFKFCSNKIFQPLTPTLSPQAGRGDKDDNFFTKKVEI